MNIPQWFSRALEAALSDFAHLLLGKGVDQESPGEKVVRSPLKGAEVNTQAA